MDYTKVLKQAVKYAIETNNSTWKKTQEIINSIKEVEHVCIFGMGKFFEDAYPYIKSLFEVDLLADNSPMKWGKEMYGLYCINPKELQKFKNVVVIIMVSDYTDIEKQLEQMNLKHYYINELIRNVYTENHDKSWFMQQEQSILNGLNLLNDEESKYIYVKGICDRIAPHLCQKSFRELQTEDEYFKMPFWTINDREGYIDVGAYTGDTVENFCKVVDYKFSFINAYELDVEVFEKLKETVEKIGKRNIRIYPYGISDINTIDKENVMRGQFLKLDDIVTEEKITLIKMDIEGAEIRALRGGRKTIKKYAPKLAICVYHKLEDFWEIPMEIKRINPQYTFRLRHHSPTVWDSVCYAYIEEE